MNKSIAPPSDAERETNTDRKEKKRRTCCLIIFIICICAVFVLLLFLMRGKTTVSGHYPENVKDDYIECSSTTFQYKKIHNVDSEKKELKISAVFSGEEELSSISLKYLLRFATNQEASDADAVAHAEFNLGLQSLGLSPDKYNNKFSRMDTNLMITLSKTDSNFDEYSRGYFLIDSSSSSITLSMLRKNYETQGFACITSEDNNIQKAQ